jgi:hypothetical protein
LGVGDQAAVFGDIDARFIANRDIALTITFGIPLMRFAWNVCNLSLRARFKPALLITTN